MKYSVLIEVAKYLAKFKSISNAYRIDDTVIKIIFDKSEEICFSLKRGDSFIFKKKGLNRQKIYNAPFDVVLHKRFAGSKIDSIEVMPNNRVLIIKVDSSSSYKAQKSLLQFEFTGKNTNAIILDEKGIVIEALRHIDSSVSFRSVKVGEILKPLPEYEIKEKKVNVEDISSFLENEYEKRVQAQIESIKKQRISLLNKKISKFQKLFDSLENEKELLKKSKKYNDEAILLLSNLHLIKDYQKEVELEDWDGNNVKIAIPNEASSPAKAANILFNKSKKLKQKADSLFKERENLKDKIEFLKNLKNAILLAKDIAEINILFPKKRGTKREQNDSLPYESFFIEGYKIMLGKNEKGNALLLKEAKKRDIWLHLKDIPSTHVIIRTDKQSVPEAVLNFAAKLCVEFSVSSRGVYLVDYTQRRNVTIVSGSNVNYTEYKTLRVKKE